MRKKSNGSGIINAGVYYLKTNQLDDFTEGLNFSFEQDFLAIKKNFGKIGVCNFEGIFIDIGIPKIIFYLKLYLKNSSTNNYLNFQKILASFLKNFYTLFVVLKEQDFFERQDNLENTISLGVITFPRINDLYSDEHLLFVFNTLTFAAYVLCMQSFIFLFRTIYSF